MTTEYDVANDRNPTRVSLTVYADLVTEPHTTRTITQGQKTTFKIQNSLRLRERIQSGKPLTIAIRADAFSATPTRETLYYAYTALIDALPAPITALAQMMERQQRRTPADWIPFSYEWESQFAKAALALITLPERTDFESYYDPRVPCPLCKNVPNSPFSRDMVGFVYPEGLRRHLLGAHSARQCGVMGALRDYAREFLV